MMTFISSGTSVHADGNVHSRALFARRNDSDLDLIGCHSADAIVQKCWQVVLIIEELAGSQQAEVAGNIDNRHIIDVLSSLETHGSSIISLPADRTTIRSITAQEARDAPHCGNHIHQCIDLLAKRGNNCSHLCNLLKKLTFNSVTVKISQFLLVNINFTYQYQFYLSILRYVPST